MLSAISESPISSTDGLEDLERAYDQLGGDITDDAPITLVIGVSITASLSDSSVFDFIVNGLSQISIDSDFDDIVSITLSLSDTLDVDDALIAAIAEALADTVNITTSSATANLFNIFSVASTLSLSGSATTVGVFVEALIAAVVLADSAWRGFDGVSSSTLTLSDASTALLVAYGGLLDTLSISDTLTGDRIVFGLPSSILDVSDSTDDVLTLLASVEDEVSLTGVIVIEDTEYLALVTNISNRAISEYDNYPFNSFAEIGDYYYGASEDGIYRLSGSDDAGTNIVAQIQTGFLDFKSANKKIVPECYIGYTSSGDLVIKLFTSEQGVKTERWYQLLRSKTTIDTDRFDLPRGVKSRYFQFELINKSGGEFEFDTIELFPVVLTRRIY